MLVTKESRRQLNLTTVLELRAQVEENMDEQLRRIISRHKFVGCVSHTTALVQYQTRLYAVNVQKLRFEHSALLMPNITITRELFEWNLLNVFLLSI